MHEYFLGYNSFTIYNYWHFLDYIFLNHDVTQGCTNFPNIQEESKNSRRQKVSYSKSHTENPQLLVDTVQN